MVSFFHKKKIVSWQGMFIKVEKMMTCTCNLLHRTATSLFRCILLNHGANKLSKGTKTVLSYFHVNTLHQNIHTALVLNTIVTVLST